MNIENETQSLIERLAYFNEWRRGVHDDMPSPKQIGEDIELAIKLLKGVDGYKTASVVSINNDI